jgi:electron transfer flavoprotein alpha subunit
VTVLCLVERDTDGPADASLRALTLARGLAQSSGEDLAAAMFGPAETVPAGMLAAFGAADAYVIESELLAGYAPVAWARALAELITVSSATAVVAAGTDRGSEVMAHLGAITGLPVAANCAAVRRISPECCQLVRLRWAGSLLEDAVLDASPALLTVAVDAVAAVAVTEPDSGAGSDPSAGPDPDAGLDLGAATGLRAGPDLARSAMAVRVLRHHPDLDEADVRIRAVESAEPSAGISLATARVVVGGGRGVGGPEGFAALEELAGLLRAAVGVSRVVTSQGWRPHKQQVGQTGTRISPELYLACGISGAIQHMAGCLSARHIVAVNTDPDAPIISRADYAVIGDLNQVIPALVTALRERAQSRSV